jgi:hypothetical protein
LSGLATVARVSSATPRPWRLALVAVALVGGLFALHGLTHHGEHVPAVSSVADVGHVDHGHSTGVQEAPEGGHHDDSGVMTLCLAMLAGAAVWLLARAVRRRPALPLLLLLPRRPLAGVPLLAGVRPHAPPGRWSLQVCRC